MSFLKAGWEMLAIANYEVDPAFLSELVPAGTELDIWQGKCYISMLGFMFTNTRVLGIRIPFHVHFEEVNLRFYVKRFENNRWKRGVVFIKEIVSKPAITWVANTLYKEHYETMPMQHTWLQDDKQREVEYRWKKAGQWQHIKLSAHLDAISIEDGSEAEFITDHFWGYAKLNDRISQEYEVRHPRWRMYEVIKSDIAVDFSLVYGPTFKFLQNLNPVSVMLVEGSDISVENKRKIS